MTDKEFAEELADLAAEYMSTRTYELAVEMEALTLMLNVYTHRIAETLVCFDQISATSAIAQMAGYMAHHSITRRDELLADEEAVNDNDTPKTIH